VKHTWKITTILIIMFLVAQLIGLFVINFYTNNDLPYGMQPPEEMQTDLSLVSIIIAFAIALSLIFLLTKIKARWLLRLWFFAVIIIALGIALSAIFFNLSPKYIMYISLIIAIPLAFFKVFKQNFLIHNLTELLVYPGIAAVFVPILNIWGIVLLLIVISLYDIYAVWHAKFMQKMAKYQINHLKFFAGFFIPYADSKERKKIKALKQKYKNKKIPNSVIKKKKIKVSLAILGGGDVVFPIIAAGVLLRSSGLIPALLVSLFATIALLILQILAKKGKFYPAMPFISAGIFVGMILGLLV